MSSVTLEQALQGEYDRDWRETEIEDGSTVVEAWYVKMPGCIAQGPTKDEALQKLEEYREPYLRKLDQLGAEIPEPDTVEANGGATETYSANTGTAERFGRQFGATDSEVSGTFHVDGDTVAV